MKKLVLIAVAAVVFSVVTAVPVTNVKDEGMMRVRTARAADIHYRAGYGPPARNGYYGGIRFSFPSSNAHVRPRSTYDGRPSFLYRWFHPRDPWDEQLGFSVYSGSPMVYGGYHI